MVASSEVRTAVCVAGIGGRLPWCDMALNA
jgi:hypothetical protein